MSSRHLGVVGIALTVLLGVPGVVALLAGNGPGILSLGGLVLVLSAAIGVEAIRRGRAPNWTVVDNKTRIRILDGDGRRAEFSKTFLLRANRHGLQHYEHRNLSADGTVSNFRATGARVVHYERHEGDHKLLLEIPYQMRRGEEVEISLMADLADSYTARPEETFTLLIEEDVKAARIEIVLPGSHRPPAAWVVHRRSRKPRPQPPPRIIDNVILWSYAKLPFQSRVPYGEFELRWTWDETSL